MTYLDHINGRKHQRYLGYSMRVEKSTKNQVTSRLSALAEVKRKAELAATTAALQGEDPAVDQVDEFENAVRRKDEEALQRKTERARRREERKKKEQEEQDEEEEELSGCLDPAMAAMMGFNGFGGSKKN
jgi:U4/U6.U5 tri-snRNP component SNU23